MSAIKPDDIIPNFTAPQSYMYFNAKAGNTDQCEQGRLPFGI